MPAEQLSLEFRAPSKVPNSPPMSRRSTLARWVQDGILPEPSFKISGVRRQQSLRVAGSFDEEVRLQLTECDRILSECARLKRWYSRHHRVTDMGALTRDVCGAGAKARRVDGNPIVDWFAENT